MSLACNIFAELQNCADIFEEERELARQREEIAEKARAEQVELRPVP